MATPYKTLLVVSCIPFSLHAMEKPQPQIQGLITNNTTQPTKPDHKNFYLINALYQKTFDALNKYNPVNSESIISLSEIITKTKELKLDNDINEEEIGLFAFKQAPSLFGSVKHPCYISYFFARIATYNAHLKKTNFKSPTPDHFTTYKNNKKIGAAVATSSKLGLIIEIEEINAKYNLIVNIPDEIAVYQFEQLIRDVNAMLHIPAETMQTITEMIYEPEKLRNSTKKL
jgi:hypothetical protein